MSIPKEITRTMCEVCKKVTEHILDIWCCECERKKRGVYEN